jgi:hypothetical protein
MLGVKDEIVNDRPKWTLFRAANLHTIVVSTLPIEIVYYYLLGTPQ